VSERSDVATKKWPQKSIRTQNKKHNICINNHMSKQVATANK